MVSLNQREQQVESLRIRFYHAYCGDAGTRRPRPALIGDWLLKAGAMAFNGHPSRYHEMGNGRRVYTVVDQPSPPLRLRLNRTKYLHVPPAELHGNVDLNYLQQNEGLMDTWYAMVFDHNIDDSEVTYIAIATKGNTAPNKMLRDYIKDKHRYEAAQLRIEQLAHKDVLDRISSMSDGTIFEIGVMPSLVEAIRAVDESLADALRASEAVYQQRVLSQVIKPDRIARFDLKERFRPVITFLLGNEQHRADVTVLRIGGMFGNSNRTTILNLLSNDLSVDVEVPYADETIAVLDADTVYNAIQGAYTDMEEAIHEAEEVSAWPEHADGTRGTSSGQTPRRPPLFQ